MTGALDVVISEGQLETVMWEKHFAPAAFDTCVRLKLKKLKLPRETTAVSTWVSNGVPMDSLP